MPLTPEKLEEYRRLAGAIQGKDRLRLRRIVRTDGQAGWLPECGDLAPDEAQAYEMLPEAIPALIAEAERLQAENGSLRTTVLEHLGRAGKEAGVSFVWREGKLTIPEIDVLRSLLREVEWSGGRGTPEVFGEVRCVACCPGCGAMAVLIDGEQRGVHAQGCRIAAELARP